MGMDLRQSWVGRIDPHDSHFLAIAIAEQQLLNAEFDYCMTSNSSGATCCRSISLILMVLLLIRHVIVIVRDVNMLQDATVLFSAILQFAGFFLPSYVIARSCYAFQHRRRRQV
uniref:Transmembrane protein n=1 Tax=Hordeum vulgare subsp. vulgare TaxID=112509 RepID=A0A8I6XYM9_HORVV